MVNSWCMRMETKNSYFKRVAQIGNSISVERMGWGKGAGGGGAGLSDTRKGRAIRHYNSDARF